MRLRRKFGQNFQKEHFVALIILHFEIVKLHPYPPFLHTNDVRSRCRREVRIGRRAILILLQILCFSPRIANERCGVEEPVRPTIE
jgi:hypothetical protein